MLNLLRQGTKVMPQESKSLRYVSYLLRLWQEQDEQAAIWRFSLDDPRTGERVGFADVETLLRFLNERMSSTVVDAGTKEEEK